MTSKMIKIKLRDNSKIPSQPWKDKNNHYISRPSSNYGIITGKINNITIIDIDNYKSNNENILLSEFKDILKNNYVVATPSGGYHIYFNYDEDLYTTTTSFNIDIRSDGGYVVGPKSKLDGIPYKIINKSKIKKMSIKLKKYLLSKILKKEKKKNQKQIKKISKNIIDESIFEYYEYNKNLSIINKLIDSLDKNYFNDFTKWLKFTTIMKRLNLYDLWDEISKKYKKYDSIKNHNIWVELNIPSNDILNSIFYNIFKNANLIHLLPYIIYKKPFSDYIKKVSGVEPNLIINKRKLGINFIKQQLSSCLIIKSDTGTGKTYSTQKYFKQNLDMPFISIVSRISLADEQYKNFNDGLLSCLHYKNYNSLNNHQDKNIIVTIDSILKMSQLDFTNYVIYLDEWSSIIEYFLISCTLDNRRILVFKMLLDILSKCKKIICTDADINKLSFKIFEYLRIPYKYIVNTYKHNNNIESEELLTESNFIDEIKKHEKYIICSDSKNSAEQIKKILDDDEIKIYVGNDDNQSEKIDLDKYNKIIYSPKIVYGLDSKMIRPVFAYYKQNTISSRNMVQQICRCRNIVKLYYFFENKKINKEKYENFEECIFDIYEKSKLCDYSILIGEKLHFLYLQLYSIISYMRDCDNVNKFLNFKLLLKNRGFIDKNIFGKSITNKKKQLKEEIKEDKIKTFNKNSDYVKLLNKILQIPEHKIDEYKNLFIDKFKLSKHFNICNMLYKNNINLKEQLDKRIDFNIKKAESNKHKIINLKNIINHFKIDIKNIDCSNVEIKKYNFQKIKRIFNYKKEIKNKYDLQKFINKQIIKLTDTKLFNKKKIDRKINKKRYQIKNLSLNENELNYHKKLYEYRNIIQCWFLED